MYVLGPAFTLEQWISFQQKLAWEKTLAPIWKKTGRQKMDFLEIFVVETTTLDNKSIWGIKSNLFARSFWSIRIMNYAFKFQICWWLRNPAKQLR